jgi:hypothetical protein
MAIKTLGYALTIKVGSVNRSLWSTYINAFLVYFQPVVSLGRGMGGGGGL